MKRTLEAVASAAVAALCYSSRTDTASAFVIVPPTVFHTTSQQKQQVSYGISVRARDAVSLKQALRPAAGRRLGTARHQKKGSTDISIDPNELPVEDFGSGITPDPKKVSILFDFDGTIGDTETPAMEVAYWELAPYFPGSADGGELVDIREYVRNNAGKAFEFMLEVVEEDRKAAGLPDIATVRAEAAENDEIMKRVNAARAGYGLKSLADLRAAGELKDILMQQKEETVDALSVVARPVEGMQDTLDELKSRGLPFAIATTSPKPRVPASVHACGLDDYFPADKIHSGESDFDPPRFKPDPSVYHKAAQFEGAIPPLCVAVEDSLSGVGSAFNAKIGLIVGYVGASHISNEMKNEHAKALRVKGARVVVDDMKLLVPLVDTFTECMAKGVDFCLPIANTIAKLPRKGVWE